MRVIDLCGSVASTGARWFLPRDSLDQLPSPRFDIEGEQVVEELVKVSSAKHEELSL
jgi:hypothetical protein